MQNTQPQAAFDTRLARHEQELRQLFEKLYHDEAACERFLAMLRRM